MFAADPVLDREWRKGNAKFKRGGVIVIEQVQCERLLAAMTEAD